MTVLGSLGSLNVLLSADTATFNTAMEKAAFTAERNFQKITKSNKAAMVAITAMVTAAAASTAVAIKRAVDHADDIGKMAQSVGLTAEQLSGLEYAAKLSGVEIDGLRTSFQKFNKAIYETAQGSKAQEEAFKAIGVSVFDASGNLKSSNDLFLESADGLSKMRDGAQKTALAMELFGKSGASLIPLLNGGADGVNKFTEAATKAGIVISGETALSAERFNDNMTVLAFTTQGMINKFTEGLLPTLVKISESIDTSSIALDGFKSFAEGVGKTIEGLVAGVINVVQVDRILQAALKGNWDEVIERYDKLAEANKKTFDSITSSTSKASEAIAQKAKSLRDATESTNTFNQFQKEGESLTTSLMTAQEKYNAEIERYNLLKDNTVITEETYARAVSKSNAELEKANEKSQKLVGWAKNVGDAFSSSFEGAIVDGMRFSDVLKGLLNDILRIIVRTAITQPIGDAITAGLSARFGGVTKSANGNVFSGGSVVPFATGGLITRPTLFPMANGGTGLAGEAGTEAIMPLFRDKNGKLGVSSGGSSGANVQVNVYAPEGSKVSQNRESTGDMEKINIMIDEAVASSVNNAGSRTHRALKGTFGIRQTLTTR